MKLAIIGSRNLKIENLEKYLPSGITEIVSGGAIGIDTIAAEYAKKNSIELTVILPKYESYGKVAPIIRNKEIVERCDYVVVFWNGHSKGALSVIKYAQKLNKPYKLIFFNDEINDKDG